MTAQTISDRQATIVEEFRQLPDWKARYRHIIQTGKALPEMPEDEREDRFKVKGCQSQVWLRPEFDGERIHFRAWSDASIVRGLIALLMRVYDAQTPEAVLAAPPDFVDALGLNEHLSQSRSNGLAAMIRQVQLYAAAFRAMAVKGSA